MRRFLGELAEGLDPGTVTGAADPSGTPWPPSPPSVCSLAVPGRRDATLSRRVRASAPWGHRRCRQGAARVASMAPRRGL